MLDWYTYSFRSLNVNSEQGVAPTWSIIHGSLADLSQTITFIHQAVDLTDTFYGYNRQIFHKYAFLFVLFQI